MNTYTATPDFYHDYIAHYNHNHDPKSGQFTSGNGSSFVDKHTITSERKGNTPRFGEKDSNGKVIRTTTSLMNEAVQRGLELRKAEKEIDEKKVEKDVYGNLELIYKGKNIYGDPENDITEKDIKDATKILINNYDKLKKQALDKIVSDDWYYDTWGKDRGLSKKEFRNALDIRGMYVTKFGKDILSGELSIYESKDYKNPDLLGGHEFNTEVTLKPKVKMSKWMSMNG